MICQRLVLVGEPSPLRNLTGTLLQTLTGVELVCAADLSAARLACGNVAGKPHVSLVLVELQRLKGNGFSLAATLSRELKSPVYLVSDRNEVADTRWCKARGIDGCLTRLDGREDFLNSVSRLLQQHPRHQPHLHKTNKHFVVSGPAEKRQVTGGFRSQGDFVRPVEGRLRRNRARMRQESRETLARLVASFDDIWSDRKSLTFVLGLLDAEFVKWSRSRLADQPDKHLIREQCRQVLAHPVTARHYPGRQLRRGMTFVIARQAADIIRAALHQHLVRLIQNREAETQRQAGQEVLRIAVTIQTLQPTRLPLRWLSDIPALVMYLSAARYALLQCQNEVLRWFVWRLGRGAMEQGKEEHARGKHSALQFPVSGIKKLPTDIRPGSSANLWSKLWAGRNTRVCAENVIQQLQPGTHRKQSNSVMVEQSIIKLIHGLYQLLVCARLGDGSSQHELTLGETILLHSLYQSSRNLLWQSSHDKQDRYGELLEMLNLVYQGQAELTLLGLCFEVCLSRAVRFKAVQQRLSGGLDLLPRPDLIARTLLHDPVSTTMVLISDLRAELDRLATDAGRLGVTWVGALAYALYQVLNLDVSRSVDDAWRNSVVRGLYRLCRMLDQAAAWQRVSTASGSINRLLQFRFDKSSARIAETGVGKYGHVLDSNNKYQRCLHLNQMVLMIVSEQKIPSGPASTLRRLIREQSRLLRDAFSP